MAKIFDRSGMWYARFMHKGKDYSRSTGIPVASGSKKAAAQSKADAEAELSRMLAEIRGRESVDALFARLLESLDRLPKSEQEPKRIMLSERLRKGVSARLAVADAWQAWLENPNRGNAGPSTVEMYLAYWGRDEIKRRGKAHQNGFKTWLVKAHPELTWLDEVKATIAEEYAGHLWALGVSPRTYNGTITFLRGMFKVLRNRAGLTGNPWEDIKAQSANEKSRRNLTEEELAKVCARAEGELRYWLAIGIYTGFRLGDAVCLKWDGGLHVHTDGKRYRLGVSFDEHCIRIIPQKTRRKDKMLTCDLHPTLESMLRELREQTPKDQVFLFPDAAELHMSGKRTILTNRIQKHFKACGIETTEAPTGGHRKRSAVRVGFHSLRHSFVSLCAKNGVPRAVVQELVGHHSPAMTAHYEHADEEQKKAAIAALPAVSFSNGEEDD